jgi:hypothetical protein
MARRRTAKTRSRGRVLVNQLGPEARQTRDNALEALHLMRSRRLSLAQAAREIHASPRTVIKYVGTALTKTTAGRYKAKPSDRLLRSLGFITPKHQITIDVRGSRLASRIATYWNAVDRYLKTGDAGSLKRFAGKSVKIGRLRYTFVTDPYILRRLVNEAQVSFLDLYANNY